MHTHSHLCFLNFISFPFFLELLVPCSFALPFAISLGSKFVMLSLPGGTVLKQSKVFGVRQAWIPCQFY